MECAVFSLGHIHPHQISFEIGVDGIYKNYCEL